MHGPQDPPKKSVLFSLWYQLPECAYLAGRAAAGMGVLHPGQVAHGVQPQPRQLQPLRGRPLWHPCGAAAGPPGCHRQRASAQSESRQAVPHPARRAGLASALPPALRGQRAQPAGMLQAATLRHPAGVVSAVCGEAELECSYLESVGSFRDSRVALV